MSAVAVVVVSYSTTGAADALDRVSSQNSRAMRRSQKSSTASVADSKPAYWNAPRGARWRGRDPTAPGVYEVVEAATAHCSRDQPSGTPVIDDRQGLRRDVSAFAEGGRRPGDSRPSHDC